MDCIFCKIAAGEIPCYKLAETDQALGFLDIMPIARGHVLVIPKRHIELFHDAEPACMGAIMELATELAAAIKKSVVCDGINMLLNAGRVAGQVVPHAHLHIIPRWKGDGIRWPWPQGTLEEESARDLVDCITGNMQ